MHTTNQITLPLDWQILKRDYDAWRLKLYETTETILKNAAIKEVSLSRFNDIGVFHKINSDYSDKMKKEYQLKSEVPHHWITKGNFAGIWCALFDSCNTYSFDFLPPIIQFTFKAEYKIYDPQLESHRKIWEAWKSVEGNLSKPNEWEKDLNDRKLSMQSRMGNFYPNHLEFYKENGFGATIGYSDYSALL